MLGKTPKWALGGRWSFTHHVLVFNRQGRREASFSGMASGSLGDWNWDISRFLCSLSVRPLHQPHPQTGPFFQPGLALFNPQFFLNHKLIFWQFSALLALIYFAPLALFAVASYFLADVQHVGVKWTQEARNVGVFVFSYAEGITWGQILLGFRVFWLEAEEHMDKQDELQSYAARFKHQSALI